MLEHRYPTNRGTTDPDVEWLFIDGSYVKAHQDSTGAATEDAEAIGTSRAGNTRTIHWAVDADGLPIAFGITGGAVHNSTEAQALMNDLPSGDARVADKGYDSGLSVSRLSQMAWRL